nr:serine/threonine-protein phosphatase 6 regulatory subunit 3-like [Nomia melanderi]
MFWTKNYVSSPNLEALLDKLDVTLYELMDEDDILLECKSQNKKLVEYLTRSDVMEELITLTTKEPSTDIEERCHYKYPSLACELLTCNIPKLNETLAGNEALLAKLYSFIDTDQPLNPLLASFFSKTIGGLIAHKTDQNWYSYQFTCLQVLEFLKSRQTFIDLLLQHLETSAIMDLVLVLVTQVEGSDVKQNTLHWLDSQQLVQRLVKLLSPNSDSSKHANAAQLLCDMTSVTRENQRTSTLRTYVDPILNTLESPDTASLLLETILTGEKLESSIVGGIQVLLTFLGQRSNNALNECDVHGNGTGDEIPDNEQRIKISNATLPYLERLHKVLLDPPYKPPVKTTAGVLECPLGNTRIHVAKLFTALLTVENVKIYETLVELGTFQTLLDLFFKYKWNNFLHTQVQSCLALAINCDFNDGNDIIYTNIFIKCRLIDKILEAWDKNDNKQNSVNGVRQGYMGHLIIIANNIVNQRKKSKSLDNFLQSNLSCECLNEWENLVNTDLAKINETYLVILGEKTPSSGENPDEYSSVSQEMDQFYNNYVGQHMTPSFTKNFGFNENFMGNQNEMQNTVEELITWVDGLSASGNYEEKEDAFNKICEEKQKYVLEDCSTGAEWGDEGDLTFQTVVDRQDWRDLQQQHSDSNSSDEDDEPWDSLNTELSTDNTLPEVNPWESAPAETVINSTGWANFDNKLCGTTEKETQNATMGSSQEETVAESQQTVKANETDHVKVEDTSVTNTNVNHESNEEEKLYSARAADRNANPSEISDSREALKEENTTNTDVISTTVHSEESSNDNKVSCSLNNATSEALLPSNDAKYPGDFESVSRSRTMEKKKHSPMITSPETVIHANLLTPTGQRLTPTGKISHAKTRVYTQRYRKEWEQMPDFKGWLTYVPLQATRAYCMYCKKNLHAHRLSLLKHTCTMKHQRAALLHEAEEKKKALTQKLNGEEEVEVEIGEIDAPESVQVEVEENDEEVEYVVERLETDDELDESQIKDPNDDGDEVEEEEEEEEEDVSNLQMPMDDDDVKSSIKKIKIERADNSEDPLAEAMDHMQSEYLEEPENQGDVQMEMVVESEDQANSDIQVVTILPDGEDSNKESPKDSRENGKTIRRGESKTDRKSSKLLQDGKQQGDSEIMVACPLPILGTAYQINSSVTSPPNTIGVLQPVNTIPIAPAQSKTITLTSGGKTLTLTGGTFQPGTQYVLSKFKNKIPTLVLADRKTAIAANQTEDAPKGVSVNKDQMAVAGTSYQSPKKHVLVKTVKSSVSKKPRISTHVVDTSKGLPVGGLQVSLYKLMDGRWTFLNESNTFPNGRCLDLVDNMKANFTAGRYKIHFDVDKYFTLRRIETMYPFIEIVFDVKDPAAHYHIPVLLSPFGYSTYRGSES